MVKGLSNLFESETVLCQNKFDTPKLRKVCQMNLTLRSDTPNGRGYRTFKFI